eukprot:9476429-Pyramimonas_sp.AAC.1
MGPLPGNQTVPRGELYMLWMAIRVSMDHLVYITDNQAVYNGWYDKICLNPSGESAELWARIGEELRRRPPEHIIVLCVNSHMSAAEAVAAGVPS